jgi:hypothetical protein
MQIQLNPINLEPTGFKPQMLRDILSEIYELSEVNCLSAEEISSIVKINLNASDIQYIVDAYEIEMWLQHKIDMTNVAKNLSEPSICSSEPDDGITIQYWGHIAFDEPKYQEYTFDDAYDFERFVTDLDGQGIGWEYKAK